MRRQPAPPRQLHRAIIVLLLIVFSVLWLVLTFPNPATVNNQSLIALGVVVLAAAIGGIAFSWGRYFRRR